MSKTIGTNTINKTQTRLSRRLPGNTSFEYVLLYGNYVTQREITPLAPRLNIQSLRTSFRHGNLPYNVTYQNVTESTHFTFSANESGQALYNQLKQWADDITSLIFWGDGAEYYVEMRKDESSDWLRSPLYHLTFTPDEGSWTWQRAAGAGWVGVTVEFERAYYVEAVNRIELPLKSSATGGNYQTGGVAIANNNNDIVVNVRGTDIIGDLEAPLDLHLTKTDAGQRTARYWIGKGVRCPNWIAPAYEGESALGISSTSSVAGNSNGIFASTTGLAAGSWQTVGYWSLNSATLANAAGAYFRLFWRAGSVFSANPTRKFRFLLRIAGTTTIFTSEEVYGDSGIAVILDMGVIQLPPRLSFVSGMHPIEIVLQSYDDTGPYTQTIDVMYLVPCDEFRVVYSDAFHQSTNVRLEINMNRPVEEIFTSWGAGKLANFYVDGGSIIHAKPGVNQNLFVLQSTSVNTSPSTMSCTVRAYYRPRYLDFPL